MTDVVERINELAAEELCGHCNRQFHELALTRQVARMFDAGRFDADYFSREDTSPIVCDGSRFIGPRRPEPGYANGGVITGTLGTLYITIKPDIEALTAAWTHTANQLAALTQWPKVTFYGPHWSVIGGKFAPPWVIWKEPEPVCPGPVPEVDVEFGPQNWLPAQEPVTVPAVFQTQVVDRWQHFTKPEPTPVPASPGYDFTAFQGDEPKYPTRKKGHHEGFRAPRSGKR